MAGPDLKGIISPDLLVWARETSHMDLETAAVKAQVSEARLVEWEAGESAPTVPQLRKLGEIYKRSIGVFFLDERPKTKPRQFDFRRLELSSDMRMSSALAAGLREAEAKRSAALDIYLQLDEEAPQFSAFVDQNISAEEAGSRLLDHLGVTMATRAKWKTDYEALSGWKAAVERLGVLIIQLSGIEHSEMRGASSASFPLPVIFLNSKDKPLGRVFSLLHELAHIARSESGLCDINETFLRGAPSQAVEVYCNHVAGAILVPAKELLAQMVVAKGGPLTEWSDQNLFLLRRTFWASRETLLRRLLILNKTSNAHYQTMRASFQKEYAAMGKGDGFVSIQQRVVLNNGRLLTQLVLDAYRAHAITGAELSRVLGTKLDHLSKIQQHMGEQVFA